MTESTQKLMTVRDQCVDTLRSLLADSEHREITRHEVEWVVSWAQRLTLRDLTMEYARCAADLYEEAYACEGEGTRVALLYADSCRARADTYTQAAAMIHQSVEQRWPQGVASTSVTPRDGDKE